MRPQLHLQPPRRPARLDTRHAHACAVWRHLEEIKVSLVEFVLVRIGRTAVSLNLTAIMGVYLRMAPVAVVIVGIRVEIDVGLNGGGGRGWSGAASAFWAVLHAVLVRSAPRVSAITAALGSAYAIVGIPPSGGTLALGPLMIPTPIFTTPLPIFHPGILISSYCFIAPWSVTRMRVAIIITSVSFAVPITIIPLPMPVRMTLLIPLLFIFITPIIILSSTPKLFPSFLAPLSLPLTTVSFVSMPPSSSAHCNSTRTPARAGARARPPISGRIRRLRIPFLLNLFNLVHVHPNIMDQPHDKDTADNDEGG